MAVYVNFGKFDSHKRLCRACKHGRIMRGVGLICDITGSSPEYYGQCSEFISFRARDDKIHLAQHEYLQNKKNVLYILVFMIVFIFFGALRHIEFAFSIALVVMFVLAINYASKPDNLIHRFGWFPYIHLILVGYAFKHKKEKSGAEIRIIQQQVLRLLGRTAIKPANNIIANKSNNLIEVEKYISKLKPRENLILFSMVCEVYVYLNLNDFLKSDVLKEIAFVLNLSTSEYLQIKKKYADREINYHKKIKDEEQKRKYQEKRRNYRVVSRCKVDYYSVLGIKKDATVLEIKKNFRTLALKFHPDKHIGNPEKQEIASEKFKKITEAYNYLRQQKGF